MEFCVLSSGSKANSVFLRSECCSVLVDCGLSARETARRLASIGVTPREISAIVVTHEHNDHVAGIPVFAKQSGARVIASHRTVAASRILQNVPPAQRELFHVDEPFEIPPFRFEPLRIDHDAAEPVAFRIATPDRSIAIITDLGHVPSMLPDRLIGLDALVLEANHDLMLLEASPYPWELKQRIRGMSGHLSNEQAGELLAVLSTADGSRLRWVVAAHVSEKANDPQLALEVLEAHWRRPDRRPSFHAASMQVASPLFSLAHDVWESAGNLACAGL